MTALTAISPQRAAELARHGAVFVDIREADEYAREHISGSRHVPLSGIGSRAAAKPGEVVIFHCRSGMRSQANEDRLAAAAASCDAYVMEGGLEAWKKAGLPVAADRKQPIEIMRQVQSWPELSSARAWPWDSRHIRPFFCFRDSSAPA